MSDLITSSKNSPSLSCLSTRLNLNLQVGPGDINRLFLVFIFWIWIWLKLADKKTRCWLTDHQAGCNEVSRGPRNGSDQIRWCTFSSSYKNTNNARLAGKAKIVSPGICRTFKLKLNIVYNFRWLLSDIRTTVRLHAMITKIASIL